MKKPRLWMVIPCYNEEDVLPITSAIFRKKLEHLASEDKISQDSKILFVNDGSQDRTWEIIKQLSKENACFIGICQSRNRGHQNAVLAGLMEAIDKCDITVSLDCDGQDDIHAMDKMINAYNDGCDVVYGVRERRDTDTFFKRVSAQGFYRLLQALGVKIIYNHADYRLISNRVLKELDKFKEVNLFLRGLIPLIGFKSTTVTYNRAERMAGKTHYSLGKMMALALDGITSLSIRPIKFITRFGIFIAFISFFAILWALVRAFTGNTVAGWASMTSILCFLSGVQLISIGILGEYIGKIYLETKARPRYIISEKTYSEESLKEKEPNGRDIE